MASFRLQAGKEMHDTIVVKLLLRGETFKREDEVIGGREDGDIRAKSEICLQARHGFI